MESVQHAKLSPSSSSRWIECPYSLHLEDLNPCKDNDNPASIRGTIIHWIGEELLAYDRYFEIGQEYTCSQGNIFILEEDMLNEAQNYKDYCLKIFDNHEESMLKVETKTDLTMLMNDTFGTLDCLIFNMCDETLHIIDLKTGRGRVKAERNTQLMLYAYGIAYQLINDFLPVDKISLHIVQNNERAGDNNNTWLTTFDEIEEFIKTKVDPAISSYKNDDEPFHKVSNTTCQWCKVKTHCKYFIKESIESVEGIEQFSIKEEKNDNFMPSNQDLEIAKLLKAHKLINDSVQQLEEHLKARVDNGVNIDGFYVAKGRKTTTWSDEFNDDELQNTLGRWVKGGKKNTVNIKLKTPKQIQELFKDDEPSTRMLNSFNNLIVTKESKTKLKY